MTAMSAAAGGLGAARAGGLRLGGGRRGLVRKSGARAGLGRPGQTAGWAELEVKHRTNFFWGFSTKAIK